MGNGWRSLSLAAASLLMALTGATVLFLGTRGDTAADTTHTIEITNTGFNPPICTVIVGDLIQWKNLDTVDHRIVIPSAGVESPPVFDSGPVAPGETSRRLIVSFVGRVSYSDPDFEGFEASYNANQPAHNIPRLCTPWTPTPTPTNTPTPTPSPTPTPTPDPRSAILPDVTRE